MSITEYLSKEPYNELKQLSFYQNKEGKTKEELFYFQILQYLNNKNKLNSSGTITLCL